MTDEQIFQYLVSNDFKIKAQDGIINILNRSYQIIDTIYNFDTSTMTVVTPDNEFTFEWILNKYE